MWCRAFLPGLGGVPLGLDLGGFPGRKLSLLKAGKSGASCDTLVTLILTPLPKLSLGAHLSLLYLESLSGSCSLQSSPKIPRWNASLHNSWLELLL